jgi:PhoH-like ATPase
MDYTGYRFWQLSEEEMAEWYSGNLPAPTNLNVNEYLILQDKDGNIVDKYRQYPEELKKVNYKTIGDGFTGITKPRNPQQELAFDMLKDDTTTIKLITGTWGTGKTMALVVAALEAVRIGKFDKIIWVRNNVQVKDTDNIGALPGDAYDKLLPYLMPFADHTGGLEGVYRLVENGTLEVIPLGFLRGRSIRRAIIISSEAENLTKEHIQLLMGRVDEGSNLWLDADLRQRDRVIFERSAGIETMIERLTGEELFGYVHLVKSERSKTAELADKLN